MAEQPGPEPRRTDDLPAAAPDMAVPFAHSIYTRSVLDCLNGRGVSPSAVLSGAGLAWQDLSDGRLIDYTVFRRFVVQAIRSSGEPGLGYLAGAMLQPYHSPVGIAAVTSERLGHGLQVLSRHANLLFGSVVFRLEGCSRWSTLEVRPLLPLQDAHHFIVQFILGALCRLLEAMLGRPVTELMVGLPHARPPGDGALCVPHIRHVEFGHVHLTLRMPLALIEAPCVSSNPKEHAEASLACRRMEVELGHGDFARRVRRSLFERLVTDPESRELASDLGISVQTMARRLAEVGTTYSDLKDDLRKVQATWYLRHTEMSMEAIAAQLGYAEQASFSRAFKRWYCTTPRTMRQSLRGGSPGHFRT